MGRGCEEVSRRKEMQILREERKRWSESTKIEGRGGAEVKRDGRGRRKRRSALCVFEYEQRPGLD